MIIKTVNKKPKEGFGWYSDGQIIINLNRINHESPNFREFVRFFKETIVHEYIHYIVSRSRIKTKEIEEEKICRIMEKF